LIEAEHDDMR